jgi:hypothetical protein
MADPLEVEGIIRKKGTQISIEVNKDSFERVGALREDPATADFQLEDGQPVRLILWDARPIQDRSDIEQVSEVQQLPKAVVAMGLRTQGAIPEGKDFMQRLLSRVGVSD